MAFKMLFLAVFSAYGFVHAGEPSGSGAYDLSNLGMNIPIGNFGYGNGYGINRAPPTLAEREKVFLDVSQSYEANMPPEQGKEMVKIRKKYLEESKKLGGKNKEKEKELLLKKYSELTIEKYAKFIEQKYPPSPYGYGSGFYGIGMGGMPMPSMGMGMGMSIPMGMGAGYGGGFICEPNTQETQCVTPDGRVFVLDSRMNETGRGISKNAGYGETKDKNQESGSGAMKD